MPSQLGTTLNAACAMAAAGQANTRLMSSHRMASPSANF
jgi:hypothetical protein